MTNSTVVAKVIIAFLVVVAVCYIWVVLVRKAKRRTGFAYAIGAAMMLLGMGNVRDPDAQTVHEAQTGRVKKGSESGDPPE